MTVFLIQEHGAGYACLNSTLHGMKDSQGMPDATGIADRTRTAFQECLGMSYAEFDEAWRAWAVDQP
jgi:hypothetical protein